jgi:sugar lactone lactonase YvrE
LLAALVVIVAVCAGSALAASSTATVKRGTVGVLALIPTPGYPALPHVIGNHVFEGTYDNPAGDHVPSRVLEYTAAGELLRSWTVRRQNLNQPHGIQVAANDTRGRLILLDKTSGRIIRLNPANGRQSLYSRVPNLPTCTTSPGKPCSPATQDLAPMPDYAAWGPDGSLYVTDYQQAVIWRIPPGGGKAEIWLASHKLDGNMFGTACILLMPDHRTLLFDQASNGGAVGGGRSPSTGKLYEVPIKGNGKHGRLKQLWQSGPADAPDGCVLSRAGHVYIALAGTSNQILELDAKGHQLARFGQQYSGANGSSVPFDAPSGLAWHGTELVIANQAYLDQNTANMALLSLATGERDLPAYVPPRAGRKPLRRNGVTH